MEKIYNLMITRQQIENLLSNGSVILDTKNDDCPCPICSCKFGIDILITLQ